MKRDAVDFHLVPDHQLKMHDRLLNWAREQRRGSGNDTTPMFRQYCSSEQWDQTPASVPTDSRDAAKINKGWKMLPANHREAIRWHYIAPGSPTKACKAIGCTMVDLARYVIDGRQMLINRGV